MRSSTPTITNNLLTSRPSTSNALPPEQRARLIHSTRKVSDVLGATPRLVGDDDESPRSKSTRPRKKPPPLSHQALVTPLSPLEEVLTPKTPTPVTRRRQKRRKMAKLQRILGETVDPRLVFPNSPVTPRESFASSRSTLVDEPTNNGRSTPASLQLPELSFGAPWLVIESKGADGDNRHAAEGSADGEVTPTAKRPTSIEQSSRGLVHRPSARTSSRLPKKKHSKVIDAKDGVTAPVAVSTSHRYSKSAIELHRPHLDTSPNHEPRAHKSLDEAKERKLKHRSTSINLSPEAQPTDFSRLKFANEGTWNRDDIEEVRKALRGLRAM